MNDKTNQVIEHEGNESLPATTETATTPIIQMIERVAMNPEANIENVERMLVLQERMLDRDQEAEFNRAMVLAQGAMPAVISSHFNKQTKSYYAKLDDINRAIVPVYTDHGFAVSFDTDSSPIDHHIRIIAHVAHRAGFSRTYKHDLPIDDAGIQGTKNKTPMHGRASTVSYGQRYLLTMIFNVSTNTDIDGNQPQQASEYLTEEQQANIKALMEELGANEARYFKHWKITSLSEVPASNYDQLIKTLEQARK